VNEKSAAPRKRIPSQQPQTGEPCLNAPDLDHPFLNSTQRSGVEFKRERSQRSKRASNARQSEALRYAGGLGRAAHQWGQGAFSLLEPLRGYPFAAGSRGVCGHTPGGVRGAEPRNAKTKPLDHTQTETARSPRLRAKATVRCPLGQQHPTQIHALGCVQHLRCVARWDNSTLPKSIHHQNQPRFVVHPFVLQIFGNRNFCPKLSRSLL
jgi:hypothetical protein